MQKEVKREGEKGSGERPSTPAQRSSSYTSLRLLKLRWLIALDVAPLPFDADDPPPPMPNHLPAPAKPASALPPTLVLDVLPLWEAEEETEAESSPPKEEAMDISDWRRP